MFRWDTSDDGQINQEELANVISAIVGFLVGEMFMMNMKYFYVQYDRAGVNDRKGERDPKKRAKDIIAKLDISGDKKLSKEEFING